MLCVSKAPSASNLLELVTALAELGIGTQDVREYASELYLSEVQHFCLCHLLNIAVKRAVTKPYQLPDSRTPNFTSQADATTTSLNEPLQSLANEEEIHDFDEQDDKPVKYTNIFWYWEEVEDPSDGMVTIQRSCFARDSLVSCNC